MVNQTENSVPNDFSDCTTKVQCSDFMKTYNDQNPLHYFELALTKLEHMLTEQQKEQIQHYIDDLETHYDPDFGRGWDIYCDILTVEQIQIVGY